MPKEVKTKTDRAAKERKAMRQHDARSGKATAGAKSISRAKKQGNATTPPREKGRASRTRSDNKKVQSGR